MFSFCGALAPHHKRFTSVPMAKPSSTPPRPPLPPLVLPHPNRLIPHPLPPPAAASSSPSPPALPGGGNAAPPDDDDEGGTTIHLTSVSTIEQLRYLPSEFLSSRDADADASIISTDANFRPLLHVDAHGNEYAYYLKPTRASVMYILFVEIMERFCFYGINYTATAYLTGGYVVFFIYKNACVVRVVLFCVRMSC